MVWKWLTPDQWSAFGTVLCAAVAILNLIVVGILVYLNKRTLDILKEQSQDLRTQAQVALQTLSELSREKRLQNERQLTRVIGRLHDLNDAVLVVEGLIEAAAFRALDCQPLKPSDWHEVESSLFEAWPQGIETTANLDLKLREIDMDLTFLSKPLNRESMEGGIAHLKQLLVDVRPLLKQVTDGLIRSRSKGDSPPG
jgi:hypothetical protein